MNEDPRRRLEDVLDREIEVARALNDTLSAERTALTGTSQEAVEKQAAEKTRLLGVIEKLESERRTLAAPQGTGIAAAVTERWRTLMELMAGCRASNEVNGYIINTRQGQINQLLGVIRGASPVTYTSQGKTLAKALRALAKA